MILVLSERHRISQLEEHDITGDVGRSMGTVKSPLLVANRRSLSGGVILDHSIVRIRTAAGSGAVVEPYLDRHTAGFVNEQPLTSAVGWRHWKTITSSCFEPLLLQANPLTSSCRSAGQWKPSILNLKQWKRHEPNRHRSFRLIFLLLKFFPCEKTAMKSVLYPYLLGETWVFDDERTSLKAEAFVMGMSEMIFRLIEAKGIPNADQGFMMTFSDEPFDGADAELRWLRADDPDEPMPGNWYSGIVAGEMMEGWLCPALLHYFDAAPAQLFVRAEPLPEGVDPIWHVAPDDPRQRRFFGPEDE